MITFYQNQAEHFESGLLVPVSFPNPSELPSLQEINSSTGDISIRIGDAERTVQRNVIRTLASFASNYERRTELRQDCGAFALAVATGDTLDDTYFERSGFLSGEGHLFSPLAEQDSIPPGGIVVLSSFPPDRPYSNNANMHLMVKASTDDKEPLYISKFGRRGIVAAHSLRAAADFYDSRSQLQIKGMVPLKRGPGKVAAGMLI